MTPSVEFLDSSHTAILVGLGLRVVSSHTAILATHREGRGGAPRAGVVHRGQGWGRGCPGRTRHLRAMERAATGRTAAGQGRVAGSAGTEGAHMTPQDTTKRQATSALDGTLCSMHTPKMATHTGTDARITWHGRMILRVVRSSRRSRRGEAGGMGCCRVQGAGPLAASGVRA